VSLIESRLHARMVVVDAGANVGIFTCALAQIVGESGFVHAFEPDPSSFSVLSANVAGNGLKGRVELNQMALGDGVGVVMLHSAGASSFVDAGSVPVQVTTLDAYAEHLSRLDVVKIDVEGYEPVLLQGAEETLRRLRPLLLVECAERHRVRNGCSREQLLAQLGAFGYRIVDSGRENRLCEPT
jgi:FkbM family methyltransferase